jgi:DNA-binding NarL/FixJ family response regulator
MVMKVAVLEDDPVVGKILQEQVNSIPGFTCDMVFENPMLYLEQEANADIILLDVSMPQMSGLDAIDPILKKNPETSIIMNTIRDDDETIFEALKRGAIGYLDKQSAGVRLGEVLDIVSEGGAYMTPRIARRVFHSFQGRKGKNFEGLSTGEKNVVSGILEGLSYKMIAERNDVTINTIRMHVKRIYRKLNINSKGELFNLANS